MVIKINVLKYNVNKLLFGFLWGLKDMYCSNIICMEFFSIRLILKYYFKYINVVIE